MAFKLLFFQSLNFNVIEIFVGTSLNCIIRYLLFLSGSTEIPGYNLMNNY